MARKPVDCNIGDFCFGPQRPGHFIADVEVKPGVHYFFRLVLWCSDSGTYTLKVWLRFQ